MLSQVLLDSELLLAFLLGAVLKHLFGELLAVGANFAEFLLVAFLAEGEFALLAALKDLGDGGLLQEVLHFALVVHVAAVVALLVVELHRVLRPSLLTV